MISTLFALAMSNGWLGGILGAAGTIGSAFFTGVAKWLTLAIGLLLVVLYIGTLHLSLAHRATELAELRVELVGVASERDEALRINERNVGIIYELTIAAAEAELARDEARAEAVKRKAQLATRSRTIAREIKDATAPNECPVAPSLRAALAGVRRDFAAPEGGD